MLRKLLLVGLVCSLGLVSATQARAQIIDPTTLHYVCTGSTVCAAGTTSLITGSTLPTFNITIQGQTGLTPTGSNTTGFTASGTLFITVLVPSSAPALTFSINGNAAVAASGTYTSGKLLDGGTGFLAASHFATANPDFNAYASASGQSGSTPTGFTVYVVNMGTITVTTNAAGTITGGPVVIASVGSGGITGLAGGFPVGTVMLAHLSTGTGSSQSLFSASTNVANSTPLSSALTIVPEPGTMALFGSGLLALGGVLRHWLRKRVQ